MTERIMKDSGVEWIKSIPFDWECTAVKNYCIDIFSGGTPKTDHPEYWDGDIKWVPSGACHDGLIFDTEKTITEEGMNNSSTKLIPANTVLLAMTGATCGNTGYLAFDSCANQSVTAYVENKEKCNSKFLWYALQSSKDDTLIHASGGAMAGISGDTCKNIKLAFPKIEEQARIAGFLDKKTSEIDAVISKTKESIEGYKKLKQSIITEAVTKGLDPNAEMKDSGIEWIGKIPSHWTIQKFKNLGRCRNGLAYSPEDQCGEEGTLVLRSSNIQNDKLSFDDCVYVNKEIPEDLYVKAGDILICSRNGSAKLIGKNAIIPNNLHASFGAFMMIYRCNCPEYLRFVLNSRIFSYYLGTFLTVSVNQLTGGNFNNIQFPYTDSLEEQKQIVEYLDNQCSKYDSIISKKEQVITELEQYKKSLIYEYVTGKKEVQQWN